MTTCGTESLVGVAAIHLLICSNFIVMHNLTDEWFVDVIFAVGLMVVLYDHLDRLRPCLVPKKFRISLL